MNSTLKLSFSILLALGGLGVLSNTNAHAQIVPDNTLGAESSIVMPDAMVDGLPSDQIDGGALRGSLLFHSFEEFNIEQGRGAYFSNPDLVNTIFSRVTGNNRSDIFGTLGVLGEADLVFLNPNGIIFGSTAQLDLRGAFTASTASEVEFSNGEVFSALNPEPSSLLTMNLDAPIGLVFEGVDSGSIINEAILVTQEDLTLSANNLELQGQLYAGGNLDLQAQNNIKIRDSEQSPFIAAAVGSLTVQGNQEIDIFALNHSDSGLFSGRDMILRSTEEVIGDAHFWSGGNFRIEKLDKSLGDLISPHDPIIRSQGDVNLFGYIGSSLHILAGGAVSIDRVIINRADLIGDTINPTNTPNLATILLSNGETITIDGSEEATLDIRAGVRSEIIGSPLGTIGETPLIPGGDRLASDIFFDPPLPGSSAFLVVPPPSNNTTVTNSDITIGSIAVAAPAGEEGTIFLSNEFENKPSLIGDINVTSSGLFGFGILNQGEDGGGRIIIDSNNNINLDSTIVSSFGGGDGGNITLLAENTISTGQIVSSFLNAPNDNGGDVIIDAGNAVFAGEILTSIFVEDSIAGNAGNVTISAVNQIDIQSISSLSRSINGDAGNGGRIELNTSGDIKVRGDITSNSVALNGTARNAGDILLEAGGRLTIDGNGEGNTITSNSFARNNSGNGGFIQLEANGGTISVDGGGLNSQSASTTNGNSGNGGRIELDATENVEIQGNVNSSSIASSGPSQNGGNITIEAGGLLSVEGDSENNTIISNSFARDNSGNGGFIQLEANGGTISINGGGLNSQSVSTTNGNSRNGGRIELDATENIEVQGDIDSSSSAVNGTSRNGGNITLAADGALTIEGNGESSTISSNSGADGNSGNGGFINLEAISGNILVNNGGLNSQSVSITGNASNGGRINLGSTNDVDIQGDIDSSSIAIAGTSQNGGNITLAADGALTIEGNGENSTISSNSGADGNSGNGGFIQLEANGGTISVDGGGLNSQSASTTNGNSGNGGRIELDATENVEIQGNVNSSSIAVNGTSRNGGNITLAADGALTIEGNGESSTISSNSGADGNSGNGGLIELEALDGDIAVIGGGLNSQSVTANGNSGNGGSLARNEDNSLIVKGVVITSGGNVDIEGGINSLSGSPEGSSGDAGQVEITTNGEIKIQDNISTATFARVDSGNGGDIILETFLNNISVDGDIDSGSTSTSKNPGQGSSDDAGQVELNAPSGEITVENIRTESGTNSGFGGDGGDIELLALNNITAGTLNSRSFNSQEGNGGGITATSESGTITTGSILSSGSLVFSNVNSSGTRGNVTLDSFQDLVLRSPFIDSAGSGSDGNITLISRTGDISLEGGFINSNGFDEADGGDIRIEGLNVFLDDVELTATSSGIGTGGSIAISTPGSSTLNNSRLSTSLEPGAVGTGGAVVVDANSVSLTDSTIDTATFGQGDAGNVDIIADDSINLVRSAIFSITDGPSDAGLVSLDAGGQIRLTENSSISTAVNRDVSDAFNIEPIGNGSDIVINGQSLELVGGSQLQALSLGTAIPNSLDELGNPLNGNSGNINIDVSESVNISGARSGILTLSGSADGGSSGDINIEAPDGLFMDDGAVLSTQTFSQYGGGNIDIDVNALTLTNGAQFITNTFGQGDAGSILVDATESVNISDNSDSFEPPSNLAEIISGRPPLNVVDSIVEFPINGIEEIESSSSFSDINNSIESAQELGTSFAINPIENPNPLIGSSSRIPYLFVFGSLETSDVDYYSFTVDSPTTRVVVDVDEVDFQDLDSADTTVRILNAQGESIISNNDAPAFLGFFGSDEKADSSILSNDPYISQVLNEGTYFIEVSHSSSNSSSSPGNYGLSISLDTPRIALGSLNVDASSGLFARTDATGNLPGSAGDISINTGEFLVENTGQVAVGGTGNGDGGILGVSARNITLNNQGRLTAATASGEGGNINLDIDNLLVMRDASKIQTDAGGSGNGGNITIDAENGFIIGHPYEDSDISANAVRGNGGDVDITTQFIFGLKFRPRLTPFSDITASSDFGLSGTVLLNTLEIDPAQSLNTLPDEPRTTEISDSCQAATTEDTVEFFNSGQGGSPPTPGSSSESDILATNWISLQLAELAAQFHINPPNESPPIPNSSEEDSLSFEDVLQNFDTQLTVVCHAN